MNKVRRAKEIKRCFDELHKQIIIKNELQLLQLEILKRMENRAIEENSDEAVKRIKKYVELRKNNIFEYLALGIKSQTINGKMMVSPLENSVEKVEHQLQQA